MTEIINGELVYNETTKNANGGTELMARRMVRDIPLDHLQGYQIIHSRVRELRPDLKKILVLHDTFNDPEAQKLRDPEYRNNFEKFVFVSRHQRDLFHYGLGIPYSKTRVISNGIEIPEDFSMEKKSIDGPIKLIYHTTPHRGLDILADVFPRLSEKFDITLDVFSSFDIYGWGHRDEMFKDIFEALGGMPDVTMHGFQPNKVVREALKTSHIFAYPSTWPETSCLALIEAMAFGNLCVHSDLGALYETANNCTHMYEFTENKDEHIMKFEAWMESTLTKLSHDKSLIFPLGTMAANYANKWHNWKYISQQWQFLLEDLR